MNQKTFLVLFLSYLFILSCDNPTKLKPVRENSIVKKHNAEYEDLRSQMKASLEKKNRFLRDNELPPSVMKSYNEGWQRVIDNDLLPFLEIDNTGEQRLVARFKSFRNMLENVNRKKIKFTPTQEQTDQYNNLQEGLQPYKNDMYSWLAKNKKAEDPNSINLEIVIFELRKIATYSIDQFLSVSIVQEKYFTKYLEKKGEDIMMLAMNGVLKR